MKLKLSDIEADEEVQPRTFMDAAVISEYAELMQEGTVFPPVVVFNDGEKNWLACGFHRYFAAEEAGFVDIEADVHDGTKRDATLYAVSTNARHGMRRTNADKQRAVETLLRDNEWVRWSDPVIAKKAAVACSTVSILRQRLEANSSIQTVESSERISSDGRKGAGTNRRNNSLTILPGVEAKKRAYEEALEEESERKTPRKASAKVILNMTHDIQSSAELWDSWATSPELWTSADTSDLVNVLKAARTSASKLLKALEAES